MKKGINQILFYFQVRERIAKIPNHIIDIPDYLLLLNKSFFPTRWWWWCDKFFKKINTVL